MKSWRGVRLAADPKHSAKRKHPPHRVLGKDGASRLVFRSAARRTPLHDAPRQRDDAGTLCTHRADVCSAPLSTGSSQVAAFTGLGLGLTAGRSGKSDTPASFSPIETHEANARNSKQSAATQRPAASAGKDLASACRTGDRLQREIALLAFADSLDEKNIEVAMDEARSLDTSERERVLTALFTRWAELAPEAAANALVGEKDLIVSALTAVAAEWAARDPAALWEWARSQTRKDFPMGTILAAIAAHDAPQAWNWARTIDAGTLKPWDLGVLIEKWGRKDGAEAVRAAQSLQRGSERDLVRDASRGWAHSSPQAAIAAAQQIKDHGSRVDMIEDLFRFWSERDPRASMDAVLDLPSRSLRAEFFRNALGAVELREPEALQGIADRLPEGSEKQQVVARLAKRLTRTDARAALAMAESIAGSEGRTEALKQLAESADFSGLAELRGEAAKLFRRADREAAEDGIVKAWAQMEPVAAATWALSAEDSDHRAQLLTNALDKWSDPAAAIRWTQTISDEYLQSIALAAALSQAARTDPLLALGSLDQLPLPKRPSATREIALTWAATDPAGACSWATQLPDMDDHLMADLVRARLDFGFAETAAWLDTLPAGTRRDAAVQQFSESTRFNDPQAALAWALTIAKPDDRESAIERVVETWRETDADSARRWIESTDALAPEIKKRLLK